MVGGDVAGDSSTRCSAVGPESLLPSPSRVERRREEVRCDFMSSAGHTASERNHLDYISESFAYGSLLMAHQTY